MKRGATENDSEESHSKKSKCENIEEEIPNNPIKKRKRMKKIYKELVSQMEFYLGDANLSKSVFLKNIIDKDGPWIDLSIFLSFNKLRSMLESAYTSQKETSDSPPDSEILDLLLTALRKISSSLLVLSEDGQRIKRNTPFQGPNENSDACTVYVENFPPNSTNDSLKEIFQKYGNVAYVSLPRYKHNREPKGFAFVEFQNEESVGKALEYFCVDKSEEGPSIEPDELLSIQSYNIEQNLNVSEETEGVKKAKKKRKRLRKDFLYAEQDLKLMTLTVMSKLSWKKLRNKYLNQQRKNISAAKLRAYNTSLIPTKIETKPKVPDTTELPFVPDVVVRIRVSEPIEDPKDYKRLISAWAGEKPVTYVDARIGASVFHVRCADKEQSAALVSSASEMRLPELSIPECQLLSGDEEKSYWIKLQEDRREKLEGKVKLKKKRGKTKAVQKIDNAPVLNNSHKFFE